MKKYYERCHVKLGQNDRNDAERAEAKIEMVIGDDERTAAVENVTIGREQ